MKNIGDIIKEIRVKKNISRAELAEKINVSYSALQHWEHNRRDVNLYYLKNICSAMNIEVNIDSNNLKIIDKDLNKVYAVGYEDSIKKEYIYVVAEYGIIAVNENEEEYYSIVHIKTLTTPYNLNLKYDSLSEAKQELERYIQDIKFPVLIKHTQDTYGKIVFIEQVYKILKELGYDNTIENVRNIAKKKDIEDINNLVEFCKSVYGNKDGMEFAEIIIGSIHGSYKRIVFNDYVRGYEKFLEAITSSTNGELRNIHQKHAFLSLMDSKRTYELDSFLSGYDEYDNAINDIIEQDIFKYGYNRFYNAVKTSMDKAAKTINENRTKIKEYNFKNN